MNKLKPYLDILKKNLVSAICAAVIILAVVLTFYPTASWYTATDPNPVTQAPAGLLPLLESRQSVATDIDSVRNKKRLLPQVNPIVGDPPPLKNFPNEKIIATAKSLFEQMKTNCDALKADFDKLNQHKLLMDGELPAPNTDTCIQFRENYLNGAANPATSVLATILNSGWPLDSQTINDLDDKNKALLESQVAVNNGVQNKAELDIADKAWEKDKPQFEYGKQLEVAQNHGVYADPAMFNSTLIVANTIPRPLDIWGVQFQTWIDQDIAMGIVHANGGPSSTHMPTDIEKLPVKRLVSMTPPTPKYAFGAAPGDATPSGSLTDNPTASITGRVSSGLYDCVQVTIVLDVEEAKLEQVLSNFTANQLLTITKLDIAPLDGPAELSKNFIYGDQPCVRVTLDVEDLFLRSWLDQYKPDIVKASLSAGKEPTGDSAH